ncbi:MAG: SDR family oxidoreductase [Chloroflexi bacterium]|nr:SDR family oxidoreductase [Chloroflexota bacterium]
MVSRLDGKTILVIGVGSGIGAASVGIFAAEGARVAGVDLRPAEEVHATRPIADDREADDRLIYIQADLTDEAAVERAFQTASSRFGRIDGVFHCVGVVSRVSILDCTMEEWQHVLAANTTSTFLVSRGAIQQMRHQEPAGGSIVHMSSSVAVGGGPGTAAYTAAKGGVSALTRQLASEYGRDKIRVNCIAPSRVEATGLYVSWIATQPDAAAAYRDAVRSNPLGSAYGRLVNPQDVAHAALFLLSDESCMISGITLDINGGARPRP